MYKNIMEKIIGLHLLISIGLFLIVYVFLCYLLIFLFIYISFLLFFLFIVILPVFFCKIIQSHLLYVRCPEGFSLFSFFLFFFWEWGGGGGVI